MLDKRSKCISMVSLMLVFIVAAANTPAGSASSLYAESALAGFSPQLADSDEFIVEEITIDTDNPIEEHNARADSGDRIAFKAGTGAVMADAVTEPYILQMGEITDTEPLGATDSLQASASLPDIALSNLRCTTSGTLSLGVAYTFQLTMRNTGGAAANNIKLTIYCDSDLVGAPAVIGSLPANTGGTVSFEFGTYLPGSHTLRVVANEDRSIVEESYTNNTVSAAFNWQSSEPTGFVDLAVYSFRNTGSNIFETGQQQTYAFEIVNYGDRSASSVPCYITANNSTLALFYIDVGGNRLVGGDI